MKTRIFIILALLLSMAVPGVLAGEKDKGKDGCDAKPVIVDPDREYRGKTYGEWHVAWWQWADSFRNNQSPVMQGSGVVPTNNQSGDVWFLAGYFGDWFSDTGPVKLTRRIKIPEGKALFFPVLNGELTPAEYEEFLVKYWDGTEPAPTQWEYLESWFADPAPFGMQATIDGNAVKNIENYTAPSPEPYTTWLPKKNNHMEAYYPHGGEVYPVVCDGFCLLVKPLSLGEHTIWFKASLGKQLNLEITYEITVVPCHKDK